MNVRPRPTLSSALCCLTLALGTSACASDSDAVEKRLAALREDIRKLQNDNDRVNERLEAMELRQAHAEASAAKPATAAASPATVERPRLKVLHLAPGDPPEAAPEPATDDGSRVILRGQGKELEIKQSAGESSSRATTREKPARLSQTQGDAATGGKK